MAFVSQFDNNQEVLFDLSYCQSFILGDVVFAGGLYNGVVI